MIEHSPERPDIDPGAKLLGREFDAPRRYGYARYLIVGGHREWHLHRGAQKIYAVHRPESGSRWAWEFDGQHGFCLSVVRVGGYDGPPELPSLSDLLDSLLEAH